MKIAKWTDQILTLVMAVVSAIIVTLSAALAQQPGPQAATSFSGTWVRPYFGVELPLSGPGPVTNSLRCGKISQCAPFKGETAWKATMDWWVIIPIRS